MTRDVVRLADFYKRVLDADNGSYDQWHQFILTEGCALTVCFDENVGENGGNVYLAFSVEDVDAQYARLKKMNVCILEAPMVRPWGMKNMSFLDPDGNRVYFRSALK